jgi:hypothetical protein
MLSLIIDFWKKFFHRFLKPSHPPEDFVRLLVEDVVPELVNKAGNQNSRIRKAAVEFIRWLAEYNSSLISSICAPVLQLPRNPVVPKFFLAKLELALMLLRSFNVSDVGLHFESFTLLALSAIEYSHKDIRETGFTLLKQIYAVFDSRLLEFISGTKYSYFVVEVD